MSDAPERKHHQAKLTSGQLEAIDRLLAEALRVGPACKRRAINKIVEKFPTFTRGECWQRIRHLRDSARTPGHREPSETADAGLRHNNARSSLRRWSAEDDDKLLNWAGYEPVEKIAHRLGRSERAVRFRLCALGMSGKVTDGWSLRELRKLLRMSPERLRQVIGAGKLRVRDPRITAASLAQFRKTNPDTGVPSGHEDAGLQSFWIGNQSELNRPQDRQVADPGIRSDRSANLRRGCAPCSEACTGCQDLQMRKKNIRECIFQTFKSL
jgi:hypothetical protein